MEKQCHLQTDFRHMQAAHAVLCLRFAASEAFIAAAPDCVGLCMAQADVAAGLSVAAMVVPQGLSYAKLAGLPQVWGLYGAFAPCIVYAGFGSSKQLVRIFLRQSLCPVCRPLSAQRSQR